MPKVTGCVGVLQSQLVGELFLLLELATSSWK